MCSISTNSKPNKKRKTEHLEQAENSQNDPQELEQNENNKMNKKQMTNFVPTSDSLSNLLVQGLQSSDDKLINDVVNKKESVIESTINNLPNAYVEPLFNFLQKCLYEDGENVNYVICLRKLFQSKISQILNIPNIRNNLKMLSDTLDSRCDLLDRCFKLKGRLDLMFLMLNKEENSIKEENIVIYEESSSEDDRNNSDDENEDRLIGLMNSDNEDEENDLIDENESDEEVERNSVNKNGIEDDENSDNEDLMDEED